MFQLKYILFFYIFSFSLLAEPKICRLGDATIILDDKAWTHISEGEELEDTYLGGHGWGHYFPRYIENNPEAKAYYDRNMKAFIVFSKKGQQLSTIIENLSNSKPVSYHTLFPAGILTEDFVLNSFKRALISNTIKKLTNDNKDTNINHKKRLFYVEHEGYLVAGRFSLKVIEGKPVYKIKTFHPDLSWYYRVDYTHHKHNLFNLDRYFTFHQSTGYWVHHGTAKGKLKKDTKNEYWPGKIARLSLQLSLNGEGQQVTPHLFVLFENLEQHLTFAPKPDEKTTPKNILDFFFDDPNNVTEKELQDLVALLNRTTNNKFSLTRNFTSLESITSRINNLMKYKQHIVFHHAQVDANTGVIEDSVKQCIRGRGVVTRRHHFADELAHYMLIYNSASYFEQKNNPAEDDWVFELARKFHGNFRAYFIDAEGARLMDENKLVFDLRLTGNDHCPYTLSFSSVENIGWQKYLDQEQNYKMLYAFRGTLNNPLTFSLYCVITMLRANETNPWRIR